MMETKVYNEYKEKWDRYWKKEEEYYSKRAEFIKNNNSLGLKKLAEDYGHSTINPGPYTIISDPFDLLNHNFILPGLDVPFLQLTSTDQNIPHYFGKRLKSGEFEGEVIGYGYDVLDDYIIIRLDDGKEKHILVNSRYEIIE